jgi:ubiquinone/menaquinone biosynthesis C-methylase UbiE
MTDGKQEKTVAYFSRWAKTYDEGPMKRWFTTVHREVIAAVDPRPTDSILDVACGTGRALRAMAAVATSGRLAGLDMSPKMIEEARSIASGIANLEFHVGSAHCLPFEDETFDHVTVMNAFHHFPDQTKALQETIRVLKKGGHAYIADITGHVLPFPIAGNKVWNLIEMPLTPQVNALSRGDFRRLFRDAGLENITQLPASRAYHRCGRYLLGASAVQIVAGFFSLWLLAGGVATGLIGAGISFPYLSKTITIGQKPK